MPVEVILPKVDMDMESGQISRWHIEEGATVKKGDILFEIETNKAAMEIEAPASGVLRDVTGKEGVDIPVGQAVAWIYEAGEEAQTPAPAAEPSGTPPAAAEAPSPSPEEKSTEADASRSSSVPEEGRSEGGKDGSIRASPLARRIAKQARADLRAIRGSGPNGRIVKADVDAFVESSRQGTSAGQSADTAKADTSVKPDAAPKPMSDDAVLRLFEEGSYELVPHDNMRKTIARRLVEAKSTIPHFYLTLDCEIDALLALRKQLNDAAPVKKTEQGNVAAYKISVNDMIIKALALALMEVPDANASWTEGAMVKHRHADVGVAVSIPGGLITPIVRKAEQKTLSAIANEMKDLAGRARNRKLKPEEYQGGTTAVSNLGMFGIKDFAAVINPPHATILAVGEGSERAVVKDGQVGIANIMTVTLSTDHRAVDGALGAELLAAFKRYIEAPMTMLA